MLIYAVWLDDNSCLNHQTAPPHPKSRHVGCPWEPRTLSQHITRHIHLTHTKTNLLSVNQSNTNWSLNLNQKLFLKKCNTNTYSSKFLQIVCTLFVNKQHLQWSLFCWLINNNILKKTIELAQVWKSLSHLLLHILQVSKFGCHSVCCAPGMTGNRIYQHGNKGIIGPWGNRV